MDDNDISKYVINLEDRLDRRVEMEEQLRRIGWLVQFSHAIRPTSADGFPSIGARGCFLSHLGTLRRGGIMRGHVLLMEDDLNFTPGFSGLWADAIAELETKDWSIFYPGHFMADLPDDLSLVDPATPIRCTHFMMIHAKAVAPTIAGLELILSRPAGHPEGGPMHIDGAYSTIRAQNPDLKTYAFSPSLGIQRASRSDISDLKLFDRIESIRPLVRRLRRIKQSLW